MGMTDQVVREVRTESRNAGADPALQAVARIVDAVRAGERDAEEALDAIGRIVERRDRGGLYQKMLG